MWQWGPRRREFGDVELFAGPFSYRVLVVKNLKHPETGQSVDGLINFDDREIYISDQASRRRWLEIVLHEYWHAWCHHFGKLESDEEQQCDRFAAVCLQFMSTWVRKGGESAIELLEVKEMGPKLPPIPVIKVERWVG
ncbi:MAG TPA: hypothetical protein DCM28_02825 [Phycisphaerales bacterium]|nr:hypothetical protein [Phycisphaerales bacterium]HCD34537.1 hypothetical protein [Phycisphaerales bacterium]|tara:strand:+ start:454 stop:867 length:414 start_codon:yes stop_codon:yes gene_type:complete